MYNIKNILSKQGWTGEEVGKALIMSLIHDYKHKYEPDTPPLFDQADLTRMLKTVKEQYQLMKYARYLALYTGLIEADHLVEAMKQQVYNGYHQLFYYATQAKLSDHTYEAAKETPLLLTEKQYHDLAEAVTEHKRAEETDAEMLVFYAILYYQEHEEEAPQGIKDALEALKSEPYTNNEILQHLDFGGYYELPDGTRSDQMTGEEWEALWNERYLNTHKYYIEDRAATLEETQQYYDMGRFNVGISILYKGLDNVLDEVGLSFDELKKKHNIKLSKRDYEQCLIRELTDMIDMGETADTGINWEEKQNDPGFQASVKYIKETILHDLSSDEEWHDYLPPDNLTKYDVLQQSEAIERYCGLFSNNEQEKKAYRDMFIADYPDLYSVLYDDVMQRMRGFDKLTWGALADAGVYYFKNFVEATSDDIIEEYNKTAEIKKYPLNGLGIIQDGSISENKLTQQGYYIEPIIPLPLSDIDGIAKQEEEDQAISTAREKLLYPALQYIYYYNALIEVLAEQFRIKDLTAMKRLFVFIMEVEIIKINNIIAMLLFGISKRQSPKEEIQEKMQKIIDLFPPLETKHLLPPDSVITQFREWAGNKDTNFSKIYEYIGDTIKQANKASGSCYFRYVRGAGQ
jgi:hypothetical protein